MKRKRIRVGDFLQAHSDFTFDIEEYLVSTTYVPLLQSQMKLYLSGLGQKSVPRATHVSMLERIKAGACQNVPAYHDYQSFDNYSSLPFITKNDLRASPDAFLSSGYARERLWRKNTSGTTGPPIPIWYSPEFYFQLLLLSLRKVAARYGITALGNTPVFCLSISDIPAASNSVIVDPADEVGFILQVVVDTARPETFARVFDLLRAVQPECLSTKPSLFELLVEYGETYGGTGEAAPLFLVSGGHLLGENLRRQLTGVFRSPVINTYGMTEFNVIASECRSGQLHLDDLALLAEVYEDGDHASGSLPGGELVLSSVENSAMPLLRYRTGDQGRITHETCACGGNGPLLVDFFGRRITCFIMSTGEKLSPTYFNDLFLHFPALNEFQIVQKDYDVFEVFVEFKADEDNRAETLRAIEAHVRQSLPVAVKVTAAEKDFRPLPKFERYLTLVRDAQRT
jgi:phenylacetate-coenzyme A ligase PaaK-like adenylate-forming protein